MKNKQLRPDGAYGRNVNGYTDHAAAQKAQFLKDGKALLKEVGNWLAARGLTEMDVRVNPSGIAGSGDVYADYWQSPDKPGDPTRRAYVNISDSALGWGRKDSLIVLARVQHYRQDGGARKPAYRMANSGPNRWLSANFDSKELADKLWQIFCPATLPDSVIAFTASGAQAIPNAIVRNDGEAAAWADGMSSVQHAFAADNEQAMAVSPANVPITLSLFNELDAQQAA